MVPHTHEGGPLESRWLRPPGRGEDGSAPQGGARTQETSETVLSAASGRRSAATSCDLNRNRGSASRLWQRSEMSLGQNRRNRSGKL